MVVRKYMAVIDNGHDTSEVFYTSEHRNNSKANLEDARASIPHWKRRQGFKVSRTHLLKHTIYG